MHGPAVVSWLLVVLCAATGGYCLTAARRGAGHTTAVRRTAVAEGLMGLGMAAMALPGASGTVPAACFVVLFGAAAAWWAWAVLRARRVHGAHHAHHALEALAMAYMAAVMSGGGPHAAHGAGPRGIPALTAALLAYFALYALYTGARLRPAGITAEALPGVVPGASAPGAVTPAAAAPGGTTGSAGTGRPHGVAEACRLALALGSFTMLLGL
jgi:hypothetical protein